MGDLDLVVHLNRNSGLQDLRLCSSQLQWNMGNCAAMLRCLTRLELESSEGPLGPLIELTTLPMLRMLRLRDRGGCNSGAILYPPAPVEFEALQQYSFERACGWLQLTQLVFAPAAAVGSGSLPAQLVAATASGSGSSSGSGQLPAALVASPGQLWRLELRGTQLAGLPTGPYLKGLRGVTLGSGALAPPHLPLPALAAATALTHLALEQSELDEDAEAVVWEALPQLEWLQLGAMAGQDATSILDQLLPYFEQPEAAARAGEHALELARQVYAVARDPSLEACNTGGGLERRMLALAQALTAWAPQAAGALEAWIGNLDTQPVVLVPLTTACNCLAAIANMATRLGVQPGAAFRIAAACQLVFGAGRLSVLQGLCHMLQRLFWYDGPDAGPNGRPAPAEAQAACAAHVAAAGVLAGMAAAAVSANGGSAGQDVGPALVDLASSLWMALRAVPSLAGTAALAPIEALLSALPQDDTSTRIKAGIVITLAEDSILSGRWAAVLARSGMLAAGLIAVAHLLPPSEDGDDELAFETLAQVAAVLTALHGAAEAAIADGAASGLPDSLAAQLGTAASAVQEPMQALLRYVTANVDGGLDQLMVQLRPLLQPAADLAALMQQYYALPEIDQPHRLAVAQAAAGRCCAYLRCANAGGEGGPAAGKGQVQGGNGAAPPAPSEPEPTYSWFSPEWKEDRRRKKGRTVFDFERWQKHRSSARYLRHMAGMFSSSVIQGLAAPLAYVVAVSIGVAAYYTAAAKGAVPLYPALKVMASAPFSLTSFALSLLLVFRTNSSYGRWDEARKMWGQVVNRSRDIARQALAYIPAAQAHLQDVICRWTIAYTRALMCHLRQGEDLEAELAGTLTPAELSALMAAKHRPNFCTQVLSAAVREAQLPGAGPTSREPTAAVPAGAAYRMDENITVFVEVSGGCERILRTPIPLGYTRHTSRFLMLWLTMLPFSLWESCGLAMIPVAALVAFLLLGVEEIGVQIEEPFSILPLEVISTTIEGNIRELQATHGAAAAVPSPINDFIRPPQLQSPEGNSSNVVGAPNLATAGAPAGRPSGGGAR
ncbi:hypothetical protein COHA_006590 [Chlorella ohadii]|uniref:Uncharacterized protein n=1 Tax=Chlorella ohadii TaxID=2649997 RepID=A0AAD5DPA6_9CHLO|nr:hypothetical protein COHA_006590 [Chlorella ohadii]